MYWGLVDRPNLMIKIPATEEGIPAIEQALYEGMNVNVTLLFAVTVLRARDGGLHPRAGAPARGGPAARPPLRRLLLRLARRQRGRQAARGRRPQRPRRPRRARQRPRRLPGVPASLRRRALRLAARSRLPGPAPAVGLDRRQEPRLPRDDVRLRPRRPRHRQHDAAADADRRRARGRGTGETAADDPTADLDALREAGIDLDDVTDKLLRDGIDAFMVPMASCSTGSSASARRSSPAARPRSKPTCRPRSSRPSPAASRAADDDVVHRIWHRDGTLWAPEGTPEVTDRLGWLDIREDARVRSTTSRLRARGARRGLHRRRAVRAWAAPASRRRCSALAESRPSG